MNNDHLNHSHTEAIFTTLTAFFCVVLVVTNTMASKLIKVPMFVDIAVPVGTITYPITFLLTDIVSEIWGIKKANLMVYLGFACSIAALFVTQIALRLPAHHFWVAPENAYAYTSVNDYQTAYSSVFDVTGVVVVASMIAYLVSQLMDIKTFHLFKRKTKGKHLWLRNNCSTMSSQLVDTIIFVFIYCYFGLEMSLSRCFYIAMATYSFKAFLALLDTPFCYLGVGFIKRIINKKHQHYQLVNS